MTELRPFRNGIAVLKPFRFNFAFLPLLGYLRYLLRACVRAFRADVCICAFRADAYDVSQPLLIWPTRTHLELTGFFEFFDEHQRGACQGRVAHSEPPGQKQCSLALL